MTCIVSSGALNSTHSLTLPKTIAVVNYIYEKEMRQLNKKVLTSDVSRTICIEINVVIVIIVIFYYCYVIY